MSVWMQGCSERTPLYLPVRQKGLVWSDSVYKHARHFWQPSFEWFLHGFLVWTGKSEETARAKISKKKGCFKCTQKWTAWARLRKQKAQQRSLIMTGTSCEGQHLNIFPSVLPVGGLGGNKSVKDFRSARYRHCGVGQRTLPMGMDHHHPHGRGQHSLKAPLRLPCTSPPD